MRIHLPLFTLVLLSGCGDSTGDIGGPPETQRFSLTVSSTGTGSGHVVGASSSTEPVIDCSLNSNGQTTGVCSGSYPEGTAVTLTVAPDESSTFDGWAGDVSICAVATSCPITITRNTAAVAQLSGPAAAKVQLRLFIQPQIWSAEGVHPSHAITSRSPPAAE